MTKVHAGLAKHGDTWFAREQTAGKGQRGRRWKSAPDQNIILSAVLEPFLPPTRQFPLSMAIAMGCFDLFSRYAGEETSVKWPNDVYWRDRKAGGILIENILQGSGWPFAVAGIGININQAEFDPELANPVSLRQITGREFSPLELAAELCVFLEKRYRQLEADPASVAADYNSQLYKKGETVKLRSKNIVFETAVCRVTDTGSLVTRDALERSFEVGEADWVIPSRDL